MENDKNIDIFEKIKESLLNIDSVHFCEKYLNIDGKPIQLRGGWKPFADIYRYIASVAVSPTAKPIILCKSRQIGATTMASALEMYFMGSGLYGTGNNRAPMRIAHIWPTLDMAFSYAKTKLSAIIAQSIMLEPNKKTGKAKSYMQALIDTSSQMNDSSQFKQFLGGSHLFIESAGLDGSRMRGKSLDALFFDEVQDIPGAAIGNSLKTLSKSKYGPIGEGIQLYFGTPKQKGSDFDLMWQTSSQQYYFLGCEKCEKHFPLYTPGSNDWESVWIHTFVVRCTHCGHEQDKIKATERGKWVATKNLNECKMIGFHINQLYIPEFPKEKIIAEKPENHPINTERAFQNEVLGEFFSGDTGIMTTDKIRDNCGDPGRKFRASISSNENKLVFMGLDIGAKNDLAQLTDKKGAAQGQSYSTAVIISVEGPHILNIEYATKLKKNDWAYKKGAIEELMKKYSVNLAVCDLGFAQDLNEILQTEMGNKFLSSMATNKLIEHIKFNDQIFPKVITFEKDFYYAELYEQMKKGHIRFPLGNYEQILWLIQHISNNEIRPSISRSGEVMPHYIKAGINDGFCALLNAYLAYKFHISNGFKIKNPVNFNKNGSKSSVINNSGCPVLGAYIHGVR